jgi:hypothetical protein
MTISPAPKPDEAAHAPANDDAQASLSSPQGRRGPGRGGSLFQTAHRRDGQQLRLPCGRFEANPRCLAKGKATISAGEEWKLLSLTLSSRLRREEKESERVAAHSASTPISASEQPGPTNALQAGCNNRGWKF